MAFAEDLIYSMNRFQGVKYVYGGPRGSMEEALTGTDCSGAVIAACEAAVAGCTGGASYTGDMRAKFLATGLWEWHDGSAGAARGDVLLYDREHPGHTAVWDGSAVIEEYPPEGRRTGWYEYAGRWDGYLRYTGPGAGTAEDDGETEGSYENMARVIVNGATLTVKDYLNVRTGPGTEYQVVAVYQPGETVHVDGMVYDGEQYVWGYYIGADSGEVRYVAVGRVAFTEQYMA